MGNLRQLIPVCDFSHAGFSRDLVLSSLLCVFFVTIAAIRHKTHSSEAAMHAMPITKPLRGCATKQRKSTTITVVGFKSVRATLNNNPRVFFLATPFLPIACLRIRVWVGDTSSYSAIAHLRCAPLIRSTKTWRPYAVNFPVMSQYRLFVMSQYWLLCQVSAKVLFCRSWYWERSAREVNKQLPWCREKIAFPPCRTK